MEDIIIKGSDYNNKAEVILKLLFEIELLYMFDSTMTKTDKNMLIKEIDKLKQLFEAYNP